MASASVPDWAVGLPEPDDLVTDEMVEVYTAISGYVAQAPDGDDSEVPDAPE